MWRYSNFQWKHMSVNVTSADLTVPEKHRIHPVRKQNRLIAHLRQRIRVQLRPLRDVTPRKEHARDLRVRPRHLAQLVLRLVAHHLDDLPLLVLRVR